MLGDQNPAARTANSSLGTLAHESPRDTQLPTTIGWGKNQVALTKGQIYYEFESRMAQQKS